MSQNDACRPEQRRAAAARQRPFRAAAFSPSRCEAFTLIELLVVIAIIAILAAILFPVFAQAREKARAVACLSNTKQIGLALMQYTQDYDETMPLPGYLNLATGARNAGPPYANRRSWRLEIQPYIKNTGVFECPSYRFPNAFITAVRNDYKDSLDEKAGIPLGYAGSLFWAHPDFAPRGRAIAEVTRPATIIAAMESRYAYPDLGTWTMEWNNFRGVGAGKGTYISHTGKSNWIFFDGHVKAINPCATFGDLTKWKAGDSPPDDFLWEWYTNGVDPNPVTLKRWQDNCRKIEEYK